MGARRNKWSDGATAAEGERDAGNKKGRRWKGAGGRRGTWVDKDARERHTRQAKERANAGHSSEVASRKNHGGRECRRAKGSAGTGGEANGDRAEANKGRPVTKPTSNKGQRRKGRCGVGARSSRVRATNALSVA